MFISDRIIPFSYRTKDGVIVGTEDCVINLYSDFITIKGERTIVVFDPVKKGPVRMTGLFIEYKGSSYGSITTSLVQLLAQIESCICPPQKSRIHVMQFAYPFV